MEIKARLSLSVPGAQMLSSQECDKNPKDNYNVDTVTIEFVTKKKQLHKENIIVKTRKCRLVKQSINISKEAYNYMTAADQPPTERLAKKVYLTKTIGKEKNGKSKKITIESTAWAQMSPMKRLNWHMSRIAESLGAVDYQFEVIDD